jgi:hypothetical protein
MFLIGFKHQKQFRFVIFFCVFDRGKISWVLSPWDLFFFLFRGVFLEGGRMGMRARALIDVRLGRLVIRFPF